MHDIKAIRDTPDVYVQGWSRRGLDGAQLVNEILALDAQERAAKTAKQEAEAARNAASKAIGAAKAKKDEAEAARLMGEVEGFKTAIDAQNSVEAEIGKRLFDLLAGLQNLPAADVPEGSDEHGNVEVRRWGAPREIAEPKDHVAIGEGLGLMDFEAAVKISGARFVALRGDLARMERALAAFMLDMHTLENGYTEVSPPLLVKDEAAFGTGQLPKFAEDLFQILTPVYALEEKHASQQVYIQKGRAHSKEMWALVEELGRFLELCEKEGESQNFEAYRLINQKLDPLYEKIVKMYGGYVEDLELSVEELRRLLDLILQGQRKAYLIPTAEVSLTNLVREQILDESQLPIRMAADTPCFRSEAGSAGRDTRGMIRMHQFRKVELVTIAHPEQSNAEHERMTACAEEVLKRLELPFRTMLLCSGDMGFSARRTYDLEVWLPSQGKYREISSCSNCGDFQARRMNARFRRPAADGKGKGTNEFVHTLNGSGLAVGRTLVAILENYQEPDGSVSIPAALQPFMGGKTRIERIS